MHSGYIERHTADRSVLQAMNCLPYALFFMYISELAASYGYELIRRSRHLIWKHRITGRVVTTSRTPSDHRALKNIESYFRKNALITA